MCCKFLKRISQTVLISLNHHSRYLHFGGYLKAAYHKYFEDIKKLVLKLDTKEGGEVQTDLHTIQHNYFGLVEVIRKLHNSSVFLLEPVRIAHNFRGRLSNIQAVCTDSTYIIYTKFSIRYTHRQYVHYQLIFYLSYTLVNLQRKLVESTTELTQ